MSDSLLDIIWSLDIERINDHLPMHQKTLKELLGEETPQVSTRNKQPHRIEKKDLEMLSELIPESEWANIKLPIILLRRTDLEKGLFSVSGGKRELFIIFRIIGRTTKSLEEFLAEDHKSFIWKPEAFTAIRKISSAIVMGYT